MLLIQLTYQLIHKNNAVSQIDSYVTNKNNAATNMINELAALQVN